MASAFRRSHGLFGIVSALCSAALAEVRVSHTSRSISGGWTEHLYSVVQTSGPGEIMEIEFGPLFADGSAMTQPPGMPDLLLSPPAGWIPYQGTFEESDTVWFGFEALPGNPGLAAGDSALFKAYTPDERFRKEAGFKCYATAMGSNYHGMTRKGPELRPSNRFVFSQDFTISGPGFDKPTARKPEHWGFAGAYWTIYWKETGPPGPGPASSSIATEFFEAPVTVPTSGLEYSLRTPTFPDPVESRPGKSGFIAVFSLEFQDGWSREDTFSLCLEDSRKGKKSDCLHVKPQPDKTGKRFGRQVGFAPASGPGATAMVKPGEADPQEEELPDGEDPGAKGRWSFQIEFAPSGDVQVLVRPDPRARFQRVLSFRNGLGLRFDRLDVSYRTSKERSLHHAIGLDDFLVIRTAP